MQWRNRWGGRGQGAECPPPRLLCWRIGKKEARKKGKRGENWEEKKVGKLQNEERTFVFVLFCFVLFFCFFFVFCFLFFFVLFCFVLFVCLFFFFFFVFSFFVLFLFCFVLFCFCFSLLKTTKICFGSTKMLIFYREKSFNAGKKIRKNDFAPSEKYACYAPGSMEPPCSTNGWETPSLLKFYITINN